jgi:glycosyltransferase involved in cell wall biosynthesis
VWQTRKIAREFKPDIIHGNIGYPGAFWSWCMSKILRKQFILTEHTRITNNFRTSIHKLLTLFSIKRAASIVAVSQWHADEIFSFVNHAPVVIPNIIDVEKFRDVRPSPVFPPVQIGFLGGLNTHVKGLDLLLKALSAIKEDFTLHIGGKGKHLEEYKMMSENLGIREKCLFYGFVRHDEVPEFMKRLHFFVSASRFETFGIVMVEAIACGLPVLATDSGGSREFMQPENGILIPAEDAESLKAGVLKLIDSYQEFNPDQIKSTVAGKFSSDAFLSKINKVYAESV